ncbi:bacterio-opsin activator [Sulfodiicoccus acidiphilus]|uniref:Bacterio-opsin activator n=1 Tax=Sulfodiicoccus acidiphilus TaxID=1670455 RepID=A0A348B615_9CREN|nr:helix-turn-helix domain-containing protein [Sulfodiicoccus acidiphilus]BBD73617.1 bacterio-opsin activator [Sulfodiicoccus acidiphilus]GGU04728.1 bacterio-opsin activator [Sulfodiicoccus acidiphilus]
MYSRYPLKLVTVTLEHDRCWTSFVKEGQIRVLSHVNNGTYVRDVVVGDIEAVRTVTRLDPSTRVKEVVNLRRYGDVVVADILLSYDNSTVALLQKNGVALLEPTVVEGTESWNFLAYEYQLRKILEELERAASVVRVSMTDYVPQREVVLSDDEVRALEGAISMGYFEVPRRHRTWEVSRKLGMSQSTFTLHLRRAQRKLATKFLNSLRRSSST